MNLAEAREKVALMYSDPLLVNLYKKSDRISWWQNKHDITHALLVKDTAETIALGVKSLFGDLIDDWTQFVVIPIASFLHDIGRAENISDHAVAGARIAHEYLGSKNFDNSSVQRICRIIANHRSGNVLAKTLDDPAWAIVVVADKCVGDEDRARLIKVAALNALLVVGQSHRNLWFNAVHDRACFAIKTARTSVDTTLGEPSIVLDLTIDGRVCTFAEIASLYDDRFRACVKCSRFLSLTFLVKVNGVLHHFNEHQGRWMCST